MGYERIQVVGNIGLSEIKHSERGTPYLKLRVAADRGQGNDKQVVWYQVLLFGIKAEQGDDLLTLYTNGRQVLVEGRPQFEAYLKKDGTAALDSTIIAMSKPELLGKKS